MGYAQRNNVEGVTRKIRQRSLGNIRPSVANTSRSWGVPRPGHLPSRHHQLMPQHRDLDIPGVRRWAEANQSEDPPDDHERQRLNHHDPQPAGDRPRWSAPGH